MKILIKPVLDGLKASYAPALSDNLLLIDGTSFAHENSGKHKHKLS